MSTPVCMIAVGIAYPPYSCDIKTFTSLQKEAADYAIKRLDPTKEEQKRRIADIRENCDWVIALAEASGIEKRHTHIKDLVQFYKDRNFFPTVQERAEIWRKECPSLAMKAVDKCLTNWGGDKDRIRTVVAHSTTGWDVPGLAHHIIFNLELPQEARAVPVMFVGCQGGMTILYVSKVIAESEPGDHLVLAVGSETQGPLARFYDEKCSLERSIYMPMVLFGEGAAASIIGRPDLSKDGKNSPLWEWGNLGAYYIPNTRHVLMIGISEEDGMYIENSIKKELPVHLNAELTKNLGKWLNNALGAVNINEIDFAVHPGGLKLLKNFAKLLEDMGCTDGESATKYSTRNLVSYGNLASAAVLFILHDLVQKSAKNHIYCMAMGPGVCMEYGGLHRYDPSSGSKRKTQTGQAGQSLTWLLFAVIIGLVAFIVSGYSFSDVKQFL